MQFFGGSEISPSPPVPTTTGNNAHMIAENGNLGVPQLPGQGCSFHSFFILVTNPGSGDLRVALKYIDNLYVESVAKNPLYAPGTPIRCELYNAALDQYVRSIA
ncbi:hypothetical protein DITRI_Ditri04bG0170600 [Diplodiscus trichospermus]